MMVGNLVASAVIPRGCVTKLISISMKNFNCGGAVSKGREKIASFFKTFWLPLHTSTFVYRYSIQYTQSYTPMEVTSVCRVYASKFEPYIMGRNKLAINQMLLQEKQPQVFHMHRYMKSVEISSWSNIHGAISSSGIRFFLVSRRIYE